MAPVGDMATAIRRTGSFMKHHVNHISAILIVATFISFTPQYRRLRTKRDSSGISLWSLFLTTLAATEQFTTLLHLFVVLPLGDIEIPRTIVADPTTLGDWLNLVQLASTWLCTLGLFCLCIRYRPVQPMTKTLSILLLTVWFGVSLGGVIFELTPAFRFDTPLNRKHFTRFFTRVHASVLNPIASLSLVGSLFAQASHTLYLRKRGALSIESLGLQAVVFGLLAASWKRRVFLPEETNPGDERPGFWDWYTQAGWVWVDGVEYALTQAVMCCLALSAVCMCPRRDHKGKSKARKATKAKDKQKSRETKGNGNADPKDGSGHGLMETFRHLSGDESDKPSPSKPTLWRSNHAKDSTKDKSKGKGKATSTDKKSKTTDRTGSWWSSSTTSKDAKGSGKVDFKSPQWKAKPKGADPPVERTPLLSRLSHFSQPSQV